MILQLRDSYLMSRFKLDHQRRYFNYLQRCQIYRFFQKLAHNCSSWTTFIIAWSK